MPDENCASYRENIPAYALGALDETENAVLRQHLSDCRSCQAELQVYTRLSQGLLFVPPQQPPASQRDALIGSLSRNRTPVSPPIVPLHFPLSSSQTPSQSRWKSQLVWSASISAFIILLILNFITYSTLQNIQNEQQALRTQIAANQTLISMLAYPGVERLVINSGAVSGSLLIDPDLSTATLIAWNLPVLPEDQTYQIWLIDEQDQRVSAGFIIAKGSTSYSVATITAPKDLSNYRGIGVTIEPAGGSSKPSGERLFRVDF